MPDKSNKYNPKHEEQKHVQKTKIFKSEILLSYTVDSYGDLQPDGQYPVVEFNPKTKKVHVSDEDFNKLTGYAQNPGYSFAVVDEKDFDFDTGQYIGKEQPKMLENFTLINSDHREQTISESECITQNKKHHNHHQKM